MNSDHCSNIMDHIKVYKTDVEDLSAAESILEKIHSHCRNYDASFDLEDCDNVLRVESQNGLLDESAIKNIVKKSGHQLETLP